MISSAWSRSHNNNNIISRNMNMDGLMDSTFARDGSFDFNTPLLSSTASSPSYDSCDPFTPRSGRSTPHGAPLDFGDSFSSAGSFSSHGSFSFDAGVPLGKVGFKTEAMEMPLEYTSVPLTPTRRLASNYPTLDLDYNTMLQVNLSQACMPSMSPTHHGMVDHYSMPPQDLQSSPFGMSTPGRSVPSSTPGNAHSMWPCNDSPIMMFNNHTPSPSPLKSMANRRDSPSPSPTCSRSSSSSRRRPIYEAQKRSMALQRHQQDFLYRMQQSPVKPDHMSTDEDDLESFVIDHRTAGRARERCNVNGCTKTYQKREHLKRHQRAAHSIGGEPEIYQCPAEGCGKNFKDRFDNFKQHLNIHKLGKSTRTPYNEDAARMYDELCKQSKTRNTRRNSRD